ncbi:hypothetical protein N182_32905 [Sinorhizobium sp. GL2]|nr:hypothetical protein N182_32905 [Sinorhizobium sp. GL2]
MVSESARDIGAGNDPRVTIVGDRAIVLFRGALNSDHAYYIYDIGNNRLLPVSIDDPWFTYGKNWMPFDNGGGLGAVHGFGPNRVLDIDLETGRATAEKVHPGGFAPRAAHDNFNMMRGGTNALYHDGALLGFGHATLTPSEHYPFQWSLDVEREASFSIDSEVEKIRRLGFSIIDPTCIVAMGDQRALVGFCCSERDWFYDQLFAEILLPAALPTGAQSPRTLAVDASQFDRKGFSQLMLGERLRCKVESSVVAYGGRRVDHQEGLVAFGQYEYLPPNRYTVSYRYRSNAAAEQSVGWADFCVCRPHQCLPVHTIALGGTDNHPTRISFEVEVDLGPDERFEARVYSSGVSVLTLYDISITAK